MTEEQLALAAEHLASSQEKFVEGIRLFVKFQTDLIKRLRVFEDYLESSQSLKSARDDEIKQIMEALNAMLNAIVETSLSLRENNERMDKLLTKVESYFGSGEGLEHEN
jgi:N-glycosylase/DNA lyase